MITKMNYQTLHVSTQYDHHKNSALDAIIIRMKKCM